MKNIHLGFLGRSLFLIFLTYLSYIFTFKVKGPMHTFMHYPNLTFHEAGHILFIPLGDFMTVLGGSLLQLIIPLLVIFEFHRKKKSFEISVGVWWFGQNWVDIAPYAGDAKDQTLMLLGGVTGKDRPGYHDWNNMLSRFDLLDSARTFETIFHYLGSFIMLGSILWGGRQLYIEWKKFSS